MARDAAQNELHRLNSKKNYVPSSQLPPELLEARRKRQREYMREYSKIHREKTNANRRESYRKQYAQIKLEIFAALGNKCIECGNEDLRVLQVDHVDGGGHAHRKASGSSIKYWMSVMKDLSPYQLLCANCHAIKTWHAAVVAA